MSDEFATYSLSTDGKSWSKQYVLPGNFDMVTTGGVCDHLVLITRTIM